MKPLDISPDFTIEDIHKIREHNYEMTKNMTRQEKMDQKPLRIAHNGINGCSVYNDFQLLTNVRISACF